MENALSAAKLRSVLFCLNENQHFPNFDDVTFFRLMEADTIVHAAELIKDTSAQLRQDVLAVILSGFKKNGYFVEIGATDGSYLSNTLLLERSFDWKGILAEPARYWHKALYESRTAIIDTRCVHSQTGKEFLFREVSGDRALSTIVGYDEGDLHTASRRDGEDYTVESVSLEDLLIANNAPNQIDYLSLDTEGSELDILLGFDFEKFQFDLISCEHNYTDARAKILNLLKSNGYTRILNKISLFDDWFVHNSCLDHLAQVLPDWQNVSSQDGADNEQFFSENERTIKMLQDTVESLIIDRDAQKTALTENIKQNKNLLQKNVNLSTELAEVGQKSSLWRRFFK